MTNGHHSPIENTSIANDEAPYDSGSDLSEIREPPVVEASPSASSTPNHQSDFGNGDAESSESSEEDDNGSQDGDSDVEESITETNHRNTRIDRSSSHDSRRPTKRKIGIEDDEYIKANPELYGLRRSVRIHAHPCNESFNVALQGRPIQHRTIVSLP